MLLDGINHVAILTDDIDRLQRFYTDTFGATVAHDFEPAPGMRLSIIHIGHCSELNVFQVPAETPPTRTPMFGRGPVDHLGLQAGSIDAFDTIRERLIATGASDGFVTDFGPVLSIFFTDPDGLECEVCVSNPDAIPGVINAPGTPAARYQTPDR